MAPPTSSPILHPPPSIVVSAPGTSSRSRSSSSTAPSSGSGSKRSGSVSSRRDLLYGEESTDAFTGIHEDDSDFEFEIELNEEGSSEAEAFGNSDTSSGGYLAMRGGGGVGLVSGLCCCGTAANSGEGGGDVHGRSGYGSSSSSQRFCRPCLGKFCSFLHPVLAVFTLGVGVATLLLAPSLSSDSPLVFIYIVVTLTCELLIMAVLGCGLLTIKLCLGERNSAHANAMCGISMRVLEGLLYYAAVAVGIYILVVDRPSSDQLQAWWDETVAAVTPAKRLEDGGTDGGEKAGGGKAASGGAQHEGPPPPQVVILPFGCYVYVLCEVILCVIFTVQSCPVIAGALGWLWHKIETKIRRRPVVSFHSSDNPVQYSTLEQYAIALRDMTNPVVVERTGGQG